MAHKSEQPFDSVATSRQSVVVEKSTGVLACSREKVCLVCMTGFVAG